VWQAAHDLAPQFLGVARIQEHALQARAPVATQQPNELFGGRKLHRSVLQLKGQAAGQRRHLAILKAHGVTRELNDAGEVALQRCSHIMWKPTTYMTHTSGVATPCNHIVHGMHTRLPSTP